MKRVFVTGATGFVGGAVLDSLTRHGHTPIALVRRGSEKKLEHKAEIVFGDVLDEKIDMKGADAVIHLVGIIREFPKKGVTFDAMHRRAAENITAQAVGNGIKRYIHMSANGTRENAVSMYHITKYQAEQAVVKSGLEYTIFRPSLIFGKKDTFINMLAGFMKKTPVFSYFGDGSYPMQPVYADDVADCFVKSLDAPETVGKTYSLCGEERVTYIELLRMISTALGRNHIIMPVPEIFIKAGIALFGKTGWFPITEDQFIMLTEGNVCADGEAFRILGIKRHPLKETVGSYLK